MKFAVVVVFAFAVLAHAALGPRELASSVRRASQIPTLRNTFTPSGFASTCGQLKCSDKESCPFFTDYEGVNCVDGVCVYYPLYSQDYCTSPDQCNQGTCLCLSSLSIGCACTQEDQDLCLLGTCLIQNGTCITSNGYIGEYCTPDNYYPCGYGNCTANNTCQFLSEGDACNGISQQCGPGLSCSYNTSTCTTSPPCSEQPDYYCQCSCEYPSFCVRGKCVTYGITEGGSCNDETVICEAGLACINSTCQQVAIGTPCEDSSDCEFLVQDCLCVAPSDKYPMECVDSGSLCLTSAQELVSCILEYCHSGEDMYFNNGSPCYENCHPLVVENLCCVTCLYPEMQNNTLPNYSGNCAQGTLAPTECCNPTVPCSILSIEEMCEGYPGYIGSN